MIKDIDYLLKENEGLIHDKDELLKKLNEANEVIEGIKSGNFDAVLATSNDTARVLVSDTADQAYRRFIENMSEGVVTIHTDGVIIYSNSSFAEMVGFPLGNVIGANLRNFIPADYMDKFEFFFKEYSPEDSKVELSILNQNGRRSHFIVSLNTLQLQDFVALNLVWTNVTDQKQTEKELIAANKKLKRAVKERIFSENEIVILNNRLRENIKTLSAANIELATFAHVASHDLQEPLRKIMIYGSILRDNYYDGMDQQGQNCINIMQRTSARMRDLINDILEYSELSQKNDLLKPTDLQSIVEDIISDFEITIKDKGATITIEKELPVIEANSSQMRQMFQNIISNSLKFIKAGTIPEISISYEIATGKEIDDMDETRANEKFYIFRIKDNGIGFSPAYYHKIFTIFQRLNNDLVYPGTGIGLAICKKIVETHNGSIAAESKPNEGALFRIILPANHTPGQKYEHQNDYSGYTIAKG